ncbi:MAG: hypothetical protein AAGF74_02075 [Pseudomonadota bacterium]
MAYVVAFDRGGQLEGWYGFSGKVVTRKSYATQIADLDEAEGVAAEWNDHFAKTSSESRAAVISTDDSAFAEAEEHTKAS